MTPKEKTQLHQILNTAHHDHEKALHSYAFFKLNSHATGKDVVQDTFIKTWKYLVRGGKISYMKAFLYRVLNNLVVDEYRKRKTLSLDNLFEKGLDLGTEDSEQHINVLDGKGALLLIKQLPKAYQEIMQMRYIKDLSVKEMSSLTGLTKNAVAVRAHRGLLKLKTLYKLSHNM